MLHILRQGDELEAAYGLREEGCRLDKATRYLRTSLAVLVTLACIYLLGQLRSFFHDIWAVLQALVIPFVASLVVTYLLQPVVEMLHRRRVPRGAAILIIYFTAAVLVAVALLDSIPVFARQLSQLVKDLPGVVADIDRWIDEISRRKDGLPDALRLGVESGLTSVEQQVVQFASGITGWLTGTVNTLFALFLVPFLVFYMLKDGRAIGRALVGLFPPQRREQVREVLHGIDDTLGRYVRGQLLVMLAVFLLTYAGLLVVGMPYAFVLALIVGITNVIPYLGPFLGAAPGLLLALTISPWLALKVLIVNVVVQQCEGNLISPQIMGRTLDLHPLAIVAAVIIGGELAGVLGLVLAVPTLAVAKVVWSHVRASRHPPDGPPSGGNAGFDKSPANS
ncbi:MAG: AI-2E family transporter [Thermoflavifilum sp.]|nr:AI-2E family transporter [Thermoflavifilum sp.]MCL6512909.1 AI-2E family transporter [Alicyclobacillus sp.]